jgi:hypothetical protein
MNSVQHSTERVNEHMNNIHIIKTWQLSGFYIQIGAEFFVGAWGKEFSYLERGTGQEMFILGLGVCFRVSQSSVDCDYFHR